MDSNIPEWEEVYNELKKNHDLAYLKIDEALRLEEEGKNGQGFGPLPILHTAVANNFCMKVFNLIKSGIYIESKAHDGSTALHIASRHGHIAMVALLVQLKANVNAKKNDQITSLHIVVQFKHYEICKLLIEHGANVNAKDSDQRTPLLYVANFGAPVEIVQLLLSKGCNVEDTLKDGRNALHLLAQSKHSNRLALAKCLILIMNQAILDSVDNLHYTALHTAAMAGSLDVAKCLLDNGATVDARSLKRTTPLHFAIDTEHFDIAELLVENRADVNAVDQTNWTPLHFASCINNVKVTDKITRFVNLLLQHGADTNVQEKPGGGTPLHLAVKHSNNNIVKVLVSNGACINAEMLQGFTPLHLAATDGNSSIIKYLLENGAFFDAKTGPHNNIDVLNLANINGNTEVVTMLKNIEEFFSAIKKRNVLSIQKCLTKGVPVNCKSCKLKSGLIYACWKGYEDVVDTLLLREADINITDENNFSALHYASKFNHIKIVRTLLNRGVMFNTYSKKTMKTPLDMAKGEGNHEIVKLFELIYKMFDFVESGKEEVAVELADIKKQNPEFFFTIFSACNRNKKTLLDVAFAGRNKDIANSLLKLLH